ncbi:MAG: DUF5674 family protein [bacterium]|nr:DUF5674 family protein [bacterium]
MQQLEKISVGELSKMAEQMYGTFVKAVVDLNRGLLVVDAEMHADEEQYLLEQGSKQEDLWGINLYPEHFGTDKFVEFDSMINIKPRQNNRSRSVEDADIREKIMVIVRKKIL